MPRPNGPLGRAAPRLSEGLAEGPVEIVDEAVIADRIVRGDLSGSEADLLELVGCRLDGAFLTGSRLQRARIVDCAFVNVDLSGVVLDDCTMQRVELRGCRLSGLQAGGCRFADVAFVDCRMDEVNLRMATLTRAELVRCDLRGADLYRVAAPGTRFERCDLTGLQVSQAKLEGSRLQGSTLERIQGAGGLRGVVVGSDQIVPLAYALLDAMGITIDDD